MEFQCGNCGKTAQQASIYTCGHWICEDCARNSTFCPLDNCDSLANDEEVQRQLRVCIDSESKQALDAYIELHYPWKCYDCQQRCRPDMCYLHQPPLATTWQCHCGFQHNSLSSPICPFCHRVKGSGEDSRNESWYSCTCGGNRNCGFCTLKQLLQSGNWRASSDPLWVATCSGCQKGLLGLQSVYCQQCRPLPFRPSQS